VFDRLGDRLPGLFGISAIRVDREQVGKARQVAGDISAGRL
jgi:hypothetical protein